MEILLSVLSIVLLVCSVVMAFVLYQLMKGVYVFLLPVLDKRGSTPLLFKLNPKIVGVLLVLCFLAMVI